MSQLQQNILFILTKISQRHTFYFVVLEIAGKPDSVRDGGKLILLPRRAPGQPNTSALVGIHKINFSL